MDRQRVECDRQARSRAAVQDGGPGRHHRHVRLVEGGAQPRDQRARARAVGARDPRQHRRTARGSHERRCRDPCRARHSRRPEGVDGGDGRGRGLPVRLRRRDHRAGVREPRSHRRSRCHGHEPRRRDAVEQSFESRVAFAGMTATTDRVIDLLDGDLYAGDPYPSYAWMPDHAPIYCDAQNELWGIARYDDIVEIEKAKDVFISSDKKKGGYRPNLPSDPSIIGLDDPLHTKRRKLVNRGFTPRTVLAWEDHIEQTVTSLLDAAITKDRVELIADLAGPLPAQMIGLLLGYPHEMWPKLMEWSARTIVGGGGPRYATDDVIMAAFEFAGACAELYEEKRRCPADDIMTVWTTAEIDGEAIGLDPVISDCLLLLDGGAETTRTVIARTILELAARPDQYQLLRDGADMTVATEEFIRWVTPVLNMCRVANLDYEIGGRTIGEGQQVVLMYPSANRDPEHFDDPERYDVTRAPNHHIAFGFGTHFCLGAALARLETRMFFDEFVRRVSAINVVPGSVDFLPNAFVNGVNRAEVELVYG